MIELYAITDHPGPRLPEVAALTAVPADGLAAVCAPAGSGAVTADDLWRHEDVVEALMRDRDLLPVRYGTRLHDESAAARAVAARREELRAALDRVRGAVELSLRVMVVADSSAPRIESGADYLRARASRTARRECAEETLHQPLSILARESRQRAPRSAAELLRAAYLVDRAAVDSFTGLVERLQVGASDMRLLCTGPWPPYSFARA